MRIRLLRTLGIALGAAASLAAPAPAARLVQVRVGNHPTFTRVVFELDAPAGYRIEKREVGGGRELLVELAASSTPRELGSRSVMVAGVEVEPSGDGSLARVRLRRAAPLVKELILAGPPRIVLDLLLPDELVQRAEPESPPAAATPRPRAAPRAEQPRAEPRRAERRAEEVGEAPRPPKALKPAPVEAEAAPGPERAKAAEPAERPALARPPEPVLPGVERALEGARIVEPQAPGLAPEAEVATEPGPAPVMAPPAGGPPAPAPGATPPEPAPVAAPGGVPAPEPAKALEPSKAPERGAQAPAAPSRIEPGRARPPGPFGLPRDADTWLTLGVVGAGLLLFLIVVAVVLRRRSRPTALDALESAREREGLGPAEEPEVSPGMGVGLELAAERFPSAAPGLFDEETDKGEMGMEAGLSIDRESLEREVSGAAGAGGDLGLLVRQLERRVIQLEARLDEAVQARERLERQVTAQSEELRVQRAAIARTQRALRGMTRGSEEQATEPALRDPSKPTAGRGA
jgi:hypothetical protein